MNIEMVAIESLSPDPANARKHGQRNLEAIVGSLRRFGQQKPIVVDSRGVVRAGNGQLAAAKRLGWTHIRVIQSDLPPVELTAFAIANNRTAELAEWDSEVLAGALADSGLGDVGFSEAELRAFAEPDEKGGRDDGGLGGGQDGREISQSFEVVAECRDERQQRELYERLKAEGYSCRLFTL